MRSGLRLWESGLHSWTATQSCRTQQIARFHRLITRRRPFLRNTVRWNSSRPTPDPTKHLGSPAPQSFFQRFKQLGKEYGWVVTGVYLGLSALDLPFCFLAVRWLGTERVGRWEHAIVGTIKNAVKSVMPDVGQKTEEVAAEAESSVVDAAAREGAGWGVEEADARNQSEEACKFCPLSTAPSLLTFSFSSTVDAVRSRLCHSQILHFPPSPACCRCHPQGRQNITRMGLANWKAKAQTAQTLNPYHPVVNKSL